MTQGTAVFKAARIKALDELATMLSVDALGILLLTPYEEERVWTTPRPAIRQLVNLALLERHPSAKPPTYRATARGVELIQHLARKHK